MSKQYFTGSPNSSGSIFSSQEDSSDGFFHVNEDSGSRQQLFDHSAELLAELRRDLATIEYPTFYLMSADWNPYGASLLSVAQHNVDAHSVDQNDSIAFPLTPSSQPDLESPADDDILNLTIQTSQQRYVLHHSY
jgi:hypothetical protein